MYVWKCSTVQRTRSLSAQILSPSTRPVIEALEERRLLTIAFAGIADRSINQGSYADLSPITFSDPGKGADPHYVRINWGDGSAANTIEVDADDEDLAEFTPYALHLYHALGQFSVSLSAWDDATPNDQVSASFTTTIVPTLPVVQVGASATRVTSGTIVSLGVAVSDAGG